MQKVQQEHQVVLLILLLWKREIGNVWIEFLDNFCSSLFCSTNCWLFLIIIWGSVYRSPAGKQQTNGEVIPSENREKERENRIGSGASIILARRRRRNTFVVLLTSPRSFAFLCLVLCGQLSRLLFYLPLAACVDDDDDFAVATEQSTATAR